MQLTLFDIGARFDVISPTFNVDTLLVLKRHESKGKNNEKKFEFFLCRKTNMQSFYFILSHPPIQCFRVSYARTNKPVGTTKVNLFRVYFPIRIMQNLTIFHPQKRRIWSWISRFAPHTITTYLVWADLNNFSWLSKLSTWLNLSFVPPPRVSYRLTSGWKSPSLFRLLVPS